MNNNNSKIIIIFLTLLVIGLSGYIIYDKALFNNNKNINDVNENETSNQDITGKIYIKRNGIIALENVPEDIVGKYVYSENDYFELNSDGTAVIVFSNGVTNNKLTYQLTYTGDFIVVELYTNEGPELVSPIMLGRQHIAGSGAKTILMTPSANTEIVYVKAS